MDLGIAGRRAIVCASSAGLGRACAEALAAEGVHVVINGRDPGRLAEAEAALRRIAKAEVTAVSGDVTTAEGRAALLAACPEADILVNNNAGPERKPFAAISEADWLGAVEASMLSPLLLIHSVLPGMLARGFGRIVNILSAQVTTPRPEFGLSSGPRAGLAAAVKGLSIEVAAKNVTLNNLVPYRLDTNRQVQLSKGLAAKQGVSYEAARMQQSQGVAAKRLGRPEELGAACAFLCSAAAGYISGQNLHLDGGSYPGLV